MNKKRAAVVGAGYLGTFHVEKYASLSDVKLVAVVDIDLAKAQRVADRFGAQPYSDYRDILNQVDLVSIAVPTEHHFETAGYFLASGIATLLEKPIAQTLEEGRQLVELANKNNTIFQIGHLERFNPAVVAIRDELKNPLFIETHRLAPFNVRGTDVDVVLDLMIHDIDLILTMTASPLVSIQSIGVPVLTDKIDIANARLEFADGCVANVIASRISNKQLRKIRVFQPSTYISIDCHKRKVSIHRKSDQIRTESEPPRIDIEERGFETADVLLNEIQAFVHAVKSDTPPQVSGEDGLRALEVAMEISRSIKISSTHEPTEQPTANAAQHQFLGS